MPIWGWILLTAYWAFGTWFTFKEMSFFSKPIGEPPTLLDLFIAGTIWWVIGPILAAGAWMDSVKFKSKN